MAYTPDWQLPRYHEQGRETIPTCTVSEASGQAVTPTAAVYELLDADGAVVYTDAAATISGTEVSATVPAANTVAGEYPLPQQVWREQWALTIGGVVHRFQRLVYLCRMPPHPVVTMVQLYGMHPEWARQVPQAYAADPGQPILDAWTELLARLLGQGVELHAVLNWYTFGVPHKYLAAHFVARAWAADNPGDSRWERRSDSYLKRYESELAHRVAVLADSDQDGVADTGHLEHVEPELFLADLPSGTYSDDGTGWS